MAENKRRRGREESHPRRVMPWGDLPRGIESAPDGLLLVEKPQGMTSHDVVGAVRRLAATRKVGHAGTLDPMATGLLIIGIGRGTKLLTYLSGATKEYDASIALGLDTTTEDADGEPIVLSPDEQRERSAKLTAISGIDAVDRAMSELRGDIEQVPSSVSAKKIDGQRAYDLVRAGESVELAARPIHVAEFVPTSELRGDNLDLGATVVPLRTLTAHASVSSGTYIRALARDLGSILGVGAHLRMLRRTRVGSFSVASAHSIEELAGAVHAGEQLPIISLSEATAGALSSITITADEARALSYGQFIDRRTEPPSSWPAGAFTSDGRIRAIVSPRGGKLKPDLILDTEFD